MKKQFDRFVLTGVLAQGPDGALYTGEEKLPGGATRPVTVKTLPPLGKHDPQAEKRFYDEVRVLAALAGQPHVVVFYGMGLTDGVPWIALESNPATLAGSMAPTPADPREVGRMLECVAQGLSSLHALTPPVLHNRLHPGNILAFGGGYYKITEFGLAAPASVEPTLSVDVVRYAAPELLNKDFGRPGPGADLYALGHIAYEMALGARLHRQQFPAVWAETASGRDANPARWQAWHHSLPTTVPAVHEIVKGFPPALGDVIARLMAKPLATRYASAEQALTDLRAESSAPSAPMPVAPAPEPAALRAAPGRPQFRPAPPPPPSALGAEAESDSSGASFAPTGNERFYVRLRNSTSGPFDLTMLQRMARQGQLSRLHQVSLDQRAWKPAASVEGLFG